MESKGGLMSLDLHQWLDTILEAYIAYILTREYYYGRSDSDLKKEEKRKQAKKKPEFESLTTGEGK